MLCDDQEGWEGVGLGGRSMREEIRVCVCVCVCVCVSIYLICLVVQQKLNTVTQLYSD